MTIDLEDLATNYKQFYDKLCEKNKDAKECENYKYEQNGLEIQYWLENWTLRSEKGHWRHG